MKKDNILVFPCGSEIGLEIHRSFYGEKGVVLFGGSSVEDHGKFVYKNYISNIPFINDKRFMGVLKKIINKYEIDYIYPAHDDVVLLLSEHADSLSCKVIGSEYETSKVCRSKKQTYDLLKDVVKTPRLYETDGISENDFPLYLKPDVGQGSKDNYIANSKKEIEFYQSRHEKLLALELLPGDEYTIDCFTSGSGKLLFVGPRKRNRIYNGISVNTFRKHDKEFDNIASLINSHLNFRGAWFFQLKKNKDGILTLLEIAPRIAGSMALYRTLGINFAVLSYYLAKGVDCDLIFNDLNIIMDRSLSNKFKIDISYKNIYIDFDDCIFINSKINIKLISLIHQCINEDIKVHLITKHKGNLNKELKKLRIENLFDTIIHIGMDEEKHRFIKGKSSIFIDDSYSERKKVKDSMGIPVFSLDAMESLLKQ